MAVIKANGYGHGMLRVAHALETTEGFAVLNLEEAVALREAGFNQAILLLEGFFGEDELTTLAEYRLASVIHCPEQIEMLEMAGLPVKLDVFLKLNSGMNRLGFRPEAFCAALQRLRTSRAVGRITLMTHFACADEAQGIAAQLACFDSLATGLDVPRSLANSAAILRYPETHGDWVRPGIMLYGSSPFADARAASLDLKPAMTLTSAVIGVQELQAGDAVGYGATFRAQQPTRVGIVACGYADGYPRLSPGSNERGTPVLVDGVRTRTVGRVSMDMITVDLTPVPEARVGSVATLWGRAENGAVLSIDEVAEASGTVGYELMCARAPRVPIRVAGA
jgi:alanine racemase